MIRSLRTPISLSLPRGWLSSLRGASTSRGREGGPLAVVSWDRRAITFVVADRGKDGVRLRRAGRLERDGAEGPLKQLSEFLAGEGLRVSRVLVVASRVDLESFDFTLPPAEDAELPALVRAQIEDQIGDADRPPQVDFLAITGDAATARQVTAFAAAAESLDRLRDDASAARWRLCGMTPRVLAGMGLLRGSDELQRPSAVAVSVLDSEVEWAVLHRGSIETLRTVRMTGDERDLVGDQIWIEIQRSLTMTGAPIEDEPHLIVFGEREPLERLTGPLIGRFGADVTMVDPFTVTRSTQVRPVAEDALGSHLYAPLVGAAKTFLEDQLVVDLLHPKEPPKPVHPLRRWGPIGALAAAALLALVYVLAGELSDLQFEHDELSLKVERDGKLVDKQSEIADGARVVDAWRADEVNWLEELRELSERLPEGKAATIRRMSGTATPAGASFELSVQVDDPSTVAKLESSLREAGATVTSRRVSERGAGSDYPWQFETRIDWPREIVETRVSPVPELVEAEPESGETPEEVDGTEPSGAESTEPEAADSDKAAEETVAEGAKADASADATGGTSP